MLHERLLNSLDSSSPLQFIEAVYGSGKRTVLRQWEDRGGRRDGEARLRFDARHLPTDPSALTRMFWSALQHRIAQDLPELPEDDALLAEAALREMRRIRQPVAVAVHEADHLDAATFEVVLRLLRAGFRLIVAGYDLSHLATVARRRGQYYSKLEDRELWLTLGETRALVEELGIDSAECSLVALHHATGGHPGMILSSLASMPVESATGVVTSARAIAAFLIEEPLDRWPARFAAFLGTSALLPRFTAGEAEALIGGEDPGHYLDRLHDLGLGSMVWHPGLQERVFRWDESIRQVILQSTLGHRAVEDEQLQRIIAAAREAGDEELLIAALVSAGDLDRAEALLREKIWDLLPNAMAPLWTSLLRRSPLDLVERPALLAARLRLSPRREHSPVSVRAARAAGLRTTDASGIGSPWQRVGDLAHALDLALYAGERERMIELFTRVRGLLEDLVTSEAAEQAGGREVSELLLIADTVFRSGNVIPAAEVARFAAQLIEIDPGRLDPRGERLAFARRLILHDHRSRGFADGLDPEPLLAGMQFLRHDCDVVVAGMTLMWGALDAGEFDAADAHLLAASERLADPDGWPILQLMRAHMAVFRRATAALEAHVSAYERGTLAEIGPFAQQPLSQMQRLTDHLSRHVGRPVASPGFLPATPETGRPFYPRTDFVVHLMEALYALRDGNVPAVRTALAAAAAVSPRRELGLYVLAHAHADEVEALQEIAADLPGGDRLRIDAALQFAGKLGAPQVDLSEREREVLGHLRRGATNPQMAQSMFVSVNTVKFHRANLMRKLDAGNRDELLSAADALQL